MILFKHWFSVIKFTFLNSIDLRISKSQGILKNFTVIISDGIQNYFIWIFLVFLNFRNMIKIEKSLILFILKIMLSSLIIQLIILSFNLLIFNRPFFSTITIS